MSEQKWPIVWNARWIWAGPPPRTMVPFASVPRPPAESLNRFCYLRRGFELASVPATVPARITADSRFVLYVNGREVSRGPARSVPARLAWNEIDLAPVLRPGANVIAALVRFYGVPVAWWAPAPPSHELGMGSFAFEAPAIALVSDGSWKASYAPYAQGLERMRGLHTQPPEVLDGAHVPDGWNDAGFDDSGWPKAYELSAGTFSHNRKRLPVEPYSAPEPSGIAPLTAITIRQVETARRPVSAIESDDPREAYPPVDVRDGADSMITYDAGGMTIATPWVEVAGPAGAIVDLHAGEERRTDGSAEPGERNYAVRYVLGGRARERFEAFEMVGFRYLTAIASNGADILDAGAIERRYPREDAARFECDDLRLNKIWRVGVRTLELCSTDAFLDCPGREQRAWVGDAYVHSLLTMISNTDWRLVRRNLRIGAQSRRPDGLLGMVSAGDATFGSTTIPSYSLMWVRALARYFEHSADQATTRELLPSAADVLNAFERYRAPDGLIRGMPGWAYVDWAMNETAEVFGVIDALYAAALDDYAFLIENVGGDRRAAADARERANLTRAGFELLWDEPRGVYVDAADERGPRRRVSQHTNAMAIVSGAAPRARWERMLDYILDESRVVVTPTIADNIRAYVTQQMDPAAYMAFDPERNVVAAQPFFSHWVHDALVRAGRRDLIAERCLKWWPQIERGNTTFEEYWSAAPGTGSRCHAWSATPTYDLTAHVLGIRPLKPGYSEAEVAPRFGALKHLEGAVPTPRGFIEVVLSRDRGGEVTVPDGTTVRLRFDDAPFRNDVLGPGRYRIGLKS